MLGREPPVEVLYAGESGSSASTAIGGRGDTRLFEFENRAVVLRRYRRGGLIGRFVADRYVWLGLSGTRALREFRVLGRLQRLRLPAPGPLAAIVERSGLTYRAALLMTRLPGDTLASRLDRAVDAEHWHAVGACIARFHAVGLWHADLNAHNILLDSDARSPAAGARVGPDSVSLIDFDRARFRAVRAESWQLSNLARLGRSLRKLGVDSACAEPMLLAGYRAGGGNAPSGIMCAR